MKTMNKLAAAVAVALSLGVAPNVNAVIELRPNGVGDALIFPVFIGFGNFQNYFTISNNDNRWVAGHIRFRGAVWSGEILDFPVILSPGDVFVFRIADVDGRGDWAIDQSLDTRNFAFTNQLCADQVLRPDPNYILIPTTGINVTPAPGQTLPQAQEAVLNAQRRTGYIEFFGTATLDGMTEQRMQGLLNNDNQLWQNRTPNPCNNNSMRGTSVWAWSDSANLAARNAPATAGTLAGATDQGLSDVRNVLSGNGFISLTGVGAPAIAYNADALVNFRTPSVLAPIGITPEFSIGSHRIENYHRNWSGVNGNGPTAAAHPSIRPLLRNAAAWDAEDSAVILYNENAQSPANAVSPWGDYVYGVDDNRQSEARIAFNNTWGPTLADGDDYNLSTTFNGGLNVYGQPVNLRNLPVPGNRNGQDDDFEGAPHFLLDFAPNINNGLGNSIAEVEEAIRLDGQTFNSIYADGTWFDRLFRVARPGAAMKSFYLAHFPTKFFHFESIPAGGFGAYLVNSINRMLVAAKPVNLQVWDIYEGIPGSSGCVTSPCVASVRTQVLGHELNFFSIGFFKNAFVQTAGRVNDNRAPGDNFVAGRVVLDIPMTSNNPLLLGGNHWPMLAHTFEATSDFTLLGQWRAMQR